MCHEHARVELGTVSVPNHKYSLDRALCHTLHHMLQVPVELSFNSLIVLVFFVILALLVTGFVLCAVLCTTVGPTADVG